MYVKMFKSIFDGSLYGQFEPTVVFMAMLVIAEREGIVDMTPQAIAARCGYPLKIVQRGIAELEKPDRDSRTPDEEGRRIVRLEESRAWGWRITNYEKYEQIRSAEERRLYFRMKKREQRAKSAMSTDVPDVHNVHQSPSGRPEIAAVFEHWKSTWGHPKAALDVKRSALIARALKGYSWEALCEAISGYRNSPHHTGSNERNTVYDDIGLLLRDSAHIDAGLRFYETPPNLSSKLTQHNVAVLAAWKPTESDNERDGRAEVSHDLGKLG